MKNNACAFRCIVVLMMVILQCACTKKMPVVLIQPFTGMNKQLTLNTYNRIKKILPNTFLDKPIPLPSGAYYQARNRYRADTLIKFLSETHGADTVIIGFTNNDISTSKGNIRDWGVMGLGFEPGNASVVSSYRLNDQKLSAQFFKIALHELGHNAGLPHCHNPHCLMRDAEGGNHLDEETGFCSFCASRLRAKGWRI